MVNKQRFPDMKNMTDYAHSLGLRAGWYGNNCICNDKCNSESCYQGDVSALIAFGFDAVKLDGCGAEYNLDLWASLINETGKAIETENCHWGATLPNATWCPWNFYRTSGDVSANFGSVMGNLETVPPLADKNLSTPGCWAYPDMLEVGCSFGPHGSGDPGLSIQETRTHFGGWAIVSSPLTLSHDVNNDTLTDLIWPVISNKEAIAVNQEYYGFSGSSFKKPVGPPAPGKYALALPCDSNDATQKGWAYDQVAQSITYAGQCVDSTTESQLLLAPCSGTNNQKFAHNVSATNPTPFFPAGQPGQCVDVWAGNGPPGGPALQIYGCHLPTHNQQFLVSGGTISNQDNLCWSSRDSEPGALSYLYKPMSWDKTKYAVLLINVDSASQDLSFTFASVPGLVGTQCNIRDIWARQDLGSATDSFTAKAVAGHDSAFLMLNCA